MYQPDKTAGKQGKILVHRAIAHFIPAAARSRSTVGSGRASAHKKPGRWKSRCRIYV